MAFCGVGKALCATTDARQYEDYVVTDAPAPPAAPVPPGVATGWAGTKQGNPWGALFWLNTNVCCCWRAKLGYEHLSPLKRGAIND